MQLWTGKVVEVQERIAEVGFLKPEKEELKDK